MKFEDMLLGQGLLKSIEKMGFEEATPIQAQTIPLALEGRDVIGQAQTGTGKTAAFGLPMLEKIDPSSRCLQGLVIAPTRELAIQTHEELYRLGREKRVRVMSVYGGADINRQIRNLRNRPHIVVGTPGRLLDHIRRGTMNLHHIETLVLDEADEMLNMGFLDDIEAIIKEVPNERQTLLFSATMPEDIKRIGQQFMKEAEHVKVKAQEITSVLIDQYFVKCRDNEKFDIMTRLFDVQSSEMTIVFARTKRRVDELARGLEMRGYNAEGIHGDLSQQKRMSVLKDFKHQKIDILVATDVAARGLDISGVTHVYNYDIPQDPESYVHRIGRTGRAGKEGKSITFVTPHEMDYLRVIERLTKKKMTPMRPPSDKEALHGQIQTAVETIVQQLEKEDLSDYIPTANYLVETYGAERLAAAYIKSLSKDASDAEVKITPERPLPRRKKERRHFRSTKNSKYNQKARPRNRDQRSRRDGKRTIDKGFRYKNKG